MSVYWENQECVHSCLSYYCSTIFSFFIFSGLLGRLSFYVLEINFLKLNIICSALSWIFREHPYKTEYLPSVQYSVIFFFLGIRFSEFAISDW